MNWLDALFCNRTPHVLRSKQSLYWFLAFATLSILFPSMFGTLAPYDDEGYVMMTIATFMHGEPLYESTHTQYGPAFYWWSEIVHSILPITHDAIRFKTLAFLSLSACLIAFAVWRISGSRWAASSIALLAILHLDKCALEPGHPQEVTLVVSLIVLLLFAILNEGRSTPTWKSMGMWLAIGMVCGFVGMVKINAGAILTLPAMAAAIAPIQRITESQLPKWNRHLLSVTLLCLPCCIAFLSRHSLTGSILPSYLALCSVIFVIVRTRSGNAMSRATLYSFAFLILGGLFSTASFIVFAMARGTPAAELVWGLLGQHREFQGTFFHAVPCDFTTLVFVVLCWLILWKQPKNNATLGITALSILETALTMFSTATDSLIHGLAPRGAANLLAFLGPVIAIQICRTRSRRGRARFFLAASMLLGPLLAYPTPGTQLAIGSLATLIGIGVLVGDSVHVFHLNQWETRPLRGLASLVVAGLCIASFGPAMLRYESFTPLDLPGCRWLRLETSLANRERDIAKAITLSGCRYLVFDGHNHNRFFFWTSATPLTAANPTFWPNMMRERELMERQERLRMPQSICLVAPPDAEILYPESRRQDRANLFKDSTLVSTVQQWRVFTRQSTMTHRRLPPNE